MHLHEVDKSEPRFLSRPDEATKVLDSLFPSLVLPANGLHLLDAAQESTDWRARGSPGANVVEIIESSREPTPSAYPRVAANRPGPVAAFAH